MKQKQRDFILRTTAIIAQLRKNANEVMHDHISFEDFRRALLKGVASLTVSMLDWLIGDE